MAAPKYTDRIKAQELRSLSLKKMIEVLNGTDEDFKKALLLRLAGSVLPRLNEHTGEEGEAIKVSIEISKEVAEKNKLYTHDSPQDTNGDSTGHA